MDEETQTVLWPMTHEPRIQTACAGDMFRLTVWEGETVTLIVSRPNQRDSDG